MSRAQQIFRSTLWNHLGKTLEYLFMYATSVMIARSLGVQLNGVFVGLISLSHLLLVLTSFGLETSLNKHIPQISETENLQKIRFLLRRLLLVRCSVFALVGALLLLGVSYLPGSFHGPVQTYVWLLVFYAAMKAIIPLFAMVLTAQLRTALTARITTSIKAIELVAVTFMAISGMSISNLFALFITTGVLHVLIYAVFSRSNLIGEERTTEVRPVLIFGGIYWVNTIVEYFLGRQGNVFLLTSLLPNPTQASLYDVAYSITQLAALAMTIGLSGVTFATFAKLAISSAETMDRFYGFLVRVISVLTIPLFAFFLFNPTTVLTPLYSERYVDAAILIQWMVAFRLCARLFGGGENAEYLLSVGRVGTVVAIGIAGAVLTVSLNLLLIPTLGASGAVISNGSANLLVNLLGAVLVYRMSSARIQLGFWLKLTVVCCISSLMANVIIVSESQATAILQIVFYLVTMLALLWLAKPLLPQDSARHNSANAIVLRKIRRCGNLNTVDGGFSALCETIWRRREC